MFNAMADDKVEKGDKVFAQWGPSGGPSGTVTEVATQGDVTMETKKGNEMKKHGDPENPALYIERSSGHDVIKKASEVEVTEKGEGNDGGEEDKDEESKEDKKEAENGEAQTGDKRSADESAEEKKEEKSTAKKQKTGKESKESKANGEQPKKKGRPAKNATGAQKNAGKKRAPKKAATESGEPRRSGRNAGK